MLPENLINLIKEAKQELKTHPNKELILPIRKKILKTFGEYESEIGKKRRTKLDILCVKYVMSVWDYAKPPVRQTPIDLVNLIEDFFQSKIEKDKLKRIADDYWTEMDDLGAIMACQPASLIGCVACDAIYTALVDNYFLYEDEFPDALDEDGDPYDWDGAFYTSGAVAGFPWNKGQQPDFRKQFWLWYINTGVPEAYNAYPER